MNNFSSFLDAPGQNMPRQAPSPSPSAAAAAAAAAAAHQNGMGGGMGGAHTNGGMPLVNGLPSGGQQTDMNHLWSVVQELSQVLEQNRAQALGIVNGVQAIHARAAEEGEVRLREVNGDGNAHTAPTPTLASVTSQLLTANARLSTLTTQNASLTSLITDYENALKLLLDKLRPYAYNQTQAILALHKHYQDLLEKERATSMQIRLEHAEWQTGLGRVAEYARMALKAQSEADVPWLREVRELREENRVLRRLAGWEERAGDSSEDEGQGERNEIN